MCGRGQVVAATKSGEVARATGVCVATELAMGKGGSLLAGVWPQARSWPRGAVATVAILGNLVYKPAAWPGLVATGLGTWPGRAAARGGQ
jgi:hypothetical protein